MACEGEGIEDNISNGRLDYMKMYDVTGAIYEGMTVYKNKPEKQPKINQQTNGYVTETRLDLDVHTGTHIDAPLEWRDIRIVFARQSCRALSSSRFDGSKERNFKNGLRRI